MSDNLAPNSVGFHINLLIEVIDKNEHLILGTSNEETIKKQYAFNSRVVIAKDINFLEAIRKDMGGEIIITKNIGPFLYFG
jgi:hypothetical protein